MITCNEARDVVLMFSKKYREAIKMGIPHLYASLVMMKDDIRINNFGITESDKAKRGLLIDYSKFDSKNYFFEFIKKKVVYNAQFEIKVSESTIRREIERTDHFKDVINSVASLTL